MKTSRFILSLIAGFAAAASLHAQTITVDKSTLTFNGQLGTTPAATQTITASSSPSGVGFQAVTNAQGAAAAWLKVSNSTYPIPQFSIIGTTGQPSDVITVTADPNGLTAGTYTGTITINTTLVNVTFNVGSIGVSPQTLAFSYQSGSGAPNQQQQLTLSGNGGFNAAAQSTGNWLAVSPNSGTVPPTNTLTVHLDQNVTPTLSAGTYDGTITITPTGTSNNTPVIVPVTLTVAGLPAATITPSAVSIAYQRNGANNAGPQQITIATNSSVTVNFNTSSILNGSNSIIQVSPSSGTIPANGSVQLAVSYNSAAALLPNTYTGSVTVFTPGQVPSQTNVPVTLLISDSPLLSVPVSALSFVSENGSIPATSTVVPTSSAVSASSATGQMPIVVSVSQGSSWLSWSPPTGVAPSQVFTGMQITIAANPTGLALGRYNGAITISGPGSGNTQTIQVTLTVANDPQIITNAPAFPPGLVFESQLGQNTLATPTQLAQTLSVTSSNGATLNYTVTPNFISCGNAWLALTGTTSGSTSGTFTVTMLPAGLPKAICSATLSIAATNPVTGNPAINSPLSIHVVYYVDPDPMLVPAVSGNGPPELSFTTSVNGPPPAPQILTVYSTNPGVTLTYAASPSTTNSVNWLSVLPLAPATGTTAAPQNTLFVQVNPTGLAAGTYTGAITIAATGATVANGPLTIPVTFTVTGGTLTLNPTSLSFAQATGGAAPVAQPVQVTSTGAQLNYTAATSVDSGTVNWLSVSAATATGATPGSISVIVDGSQLTPGTYTGKVTLTAANAAPATLPVTLTVSAGAISAPTTTLTFKQTAGGTAPASQSIAVTGTPSALSFTVTTNMTNGTGWLSAVVGSGTATTGTTPATVSVSVSAGSLPVGTYNGSVVITSTGASGSPITVPVVLNVTAPQSLSFSSSTPLAFSYTIGVTPTPLTETVNLTSSGSTQFTATASAQNNGTWLSVSPASGTATSTATKLTVSVTPTNLAAGTYSGTISVSSPDSLTPLTLAVNLTVVAVAPPTLTAIENSASYATGAVAPGELVLIIGTNVGPNVAVSSLPNGTVSNNQLSTTVGQTQVLFDNVPAPIYYASATQTAVFVPYEVAGRPTTQVMVVTQGVSSTPVTYNVVSAQPGIFTQNSQGTGPGSILNQDNSHNGPNNGAAGGSVIQVFMTGEGQTSPAGVTGLVIPSNGSGLKNPVGTVTASIGGVPLPASAILYAGSAPGDVSGVFQVDLIVPSGLGAGPQPIVVSVGGNASQNAVTVQLK